MNQSCKFCEKSGLLILPLRYAAVVGDHASEWLPKMPATLGKNVSDLTLARAAYAPRMIRQGFIYVLINRAGKLYWEAYFTTEDGYLAKFPPEVPPEVAASFTCKTGAHRTNASVIAIEKVTSVNKIYLLFSPTALSIKKMQEYQNNPDRRVERGQLQSFDPKAWVAENTKQEHSLQPEQLNDHVPEFLLHQQLDDAFISNRGKMLMEQMHPAIRDSFVGSKHSSSKVPTTRLGLLAHELKVSKSAVFVIFDHIGITQELNNFRNAAGEPMRKFMESVDKWKVSNQRKFNVMQAIEDTRIGYISRSISTKDRYLGWIRPRLAVDDLIKERDSLRAQGRIADADQKEKLILKMLEENASRAEVFSNENAAENWEGKYGRLLDIESIAKLRNAIHSLSKSCSARAAERYEDHAKWVQSERLVEAFEMYDPENLGSGFCFSSEHMLCTDGMFGVEQNVPLLKEWMSDGEIARKNLFLRACFFNQENMQLQARAAFADAKKQADAVELANVASVPWLKAAKGLIDTSKKIDSAWDEWLRDSSVRLNQKPQVGVLTPTDIKDLSLFHHTAEGRFFRMIASWTQSVSSKAGHMDKGISAIVTMLVFSRLGDLSEKIGIEEYLGKMTRARAEELARTKESAQKKRATAAARNKAYLKNKAAIQKAARDLSNIEAGKLDDLAAQLIRDEQIKVKNKVELSLDALSDGERPSTNNFRQSRLGCLLLSIETLSLTIKLNDHRDSPRLSAEITASLLSVTSMTIDILYSATKSVREIFVKGEMLGVSGALDVARGGMKLVSGVASCAAGIITGTLDITSALDKQANGDFALMAIYGSRGLAGYGSAVSGIVAAYSYSGAMLSRISAVTAERIGFYRITYALARGAEFANALVKYRTFWLIRLARFNMVGLGLTALEIGYEVFVKDDELENWMQACCLRKLSALDISLERPFASEEQELRTLESAFNAIIK